MAPQKCEEPPSKMWSYVRLTLPGHDPILGVPSQRTRVVMRVGMTLVRSTCFYTFMSSNCICNQMSVHNSQPLEFCIHSCYVLTVL